MTTNKCWWFSNVRWRMVPAMRRTVAQSPPEEQCDWEMAQHGSAGFQAKLRGCRFLLRFISMWMLFSWCPPKLLPHISYGNKNRCFSLWWLKWAYKYLLCLKHNLRMGISGVLGIQKVRRNKWDRLGDSFSFSFP